MFMSVCLTESYMWDYFLWPIPLPVSNTDLLYQAIWLHSKAHCSFSPWDLSTSCKHGMPRHLWILLCHAGDRGGDETWEKRWNFPSTIKESSLLQFPVVPLWNGWRGLKSWGWDPSGGHLPNSQCGWLAGIQWYQTLIQRASSWSQSIYHLLWLPNKSSVKVRELCKLQRPEVALVSLVLPLSFTAPKL